MPVISRVKVMANMNIAERRLPQDGRIEKHRGHVVDMRVSTLPTQFGERCLRVLDRSTVNPILGIGMPDYIHDYIVDGSIGLTASSSRPDDGSGKTTLYSLRKSTPSIPNC